GRIRSFSPKELEHVSRAAAILFDKKRRMWLGDSSGVHVYETADVFAPKTRRAEGHHVRCLLEAKDGAVWIGTRTGLIRVIGDKEILWNGFPHPDVTALHQDHRERIWAATKGN